MKFNKNDIGMYLGTTLLGASFGLLAGAMITALIQRRRERLWLEQEADEPEEEYDFENDEIWKEANEAYDRLTGIYRESEEDLAEDMKLEEELAEFIETYNPNSMQIALVRSGTVEMEEMIKVLTDVDTPQIDYSKPYRKTIEEYAASDDKPDLSTLTTMPEDEGVVNEHWKLSSTVPSHKRRDLIRNLYYDPEDEQFAKLHPNGELMPLLNLEDIVPDAEVVQMALMYFLEGIVPIFITDIRTNRVYCIEEMQQ